MIKKLKKAIKKIKDDDLYSTEDVFALGVIVNIKLEPSIITFYRLIKKGKLDAVDVGAGKHSRFFIKEKYKSMLLLIPQQSQESPPYSNLG